MDHFEKSYHILQIMRRLKETVHQNMEKRFGEFTLTGPQGMVIGLLSRHGEMKVSDLSTKMGLSNSTVSGIIDRLENLGYVERTRSTQDRRVVHVNLSPSFCEKSKDHFKPFDESITGLMENATPEEAEKILLGFETLDLLMSRIQCNNKKE